MKQIYTLFAGLVVAAAITLLASCSKKDDNGNSNNGNGNQVGISGMKKQIVGIWKVQSKSRLTTDANGNPQTVDLLNSCEKDDIYTFIENFYTVEPGAVACSYLYGYSKQFPWVLYNDSTFDFAHGPGFNTNPRLDFVDATTLQLSARLAGTSDKEVFVYKRQ